MRARGQKTKPLLVRQLPHDILQTLEICLGPDQHASKKCWQNIASKYGVDAMERFHLEAQRNKVTEMFCHHPNFTDYEYDQLLADLKEFGRLDVLDYLEEKHNIG